MNNIILTDPCTGYVQILYHHHQARNQSGAIGQLPPPKFSQTYVFVRCSNKLHHFARKYQLVAALIITST